MFQSHKIGDTPRSNTSNFHKSFTDTANGIPSFLQPKITSTPLVRRESVFATPPKPHVLSPRRYSLSEIATPPRSNRDLSRVHTPGPLLASTKYNLNVSTYEDTKSPGLAGRIVQYNEETQREKQHQRPPTHQSKYGSPGLFPVVHLFKKKLPTLEQKPRTVTIRIASPEYSRHHSQEYNRQLLEGIIKPNSPNANRRSIFASPGGEGNNSSARSVLEALKEISRKRIHASEEYELNEDSGKRLRTENLSETDSNKRVRDDSPLLDNSTSPNKSSSKRICMYDEYSASCSSMNFSLNKTEQPSLKRKSVSISTLTENKKAPKPIKLINVETQTIPSESEDQVHANKAVPEDQTETNTTQANDNQQVKEKESLLQIFNNVPLDRIRKNRLAALMGSLSGKDSTVAEHEDDDVSTFDAADGLTPEVSKAPEVSKPLISILSSPKKDSPQRSNKHVHFSIPESTSQPNLPATSINNYSLTRSSASITAPISSTCEVKSTFELNKNDKLETPAPPSSPVGLSPIPSDTTVTMPVAVSFGSGSNSSSATSVVSKESSTSLLNTNVSKNDTAPPPSFQFKFPTTSNAVLGVTTSSMMFPTSVSMSQTGFGSVVTPSSAPAPVVSSPPKMGGFKFDLSKPSNTAASIPTTNAVAVTNSVPTFSFGSQTDPNKNKSLFGNIPSSTMTQLPQGPTSAAFSFGVKSTTPSFSPNTTLAKTSTPSTNVLVSTASSSSLGSTSSNVSMTPAFKFGAPTVENKPTSGFGASNTSGLNFGPNSAPSAVPAFGNTSTASSVITTTASLLGTTKAPMFSFGGPSTTSKVGSFGIASTTAASITFGSPSTTPVSNAFGAPAAGGFGVPNKSQPSNSFNATTTSSSLGGFGTPPTTSVASFGTPTVTPMFGGNKPAPFGVVTTNATIPFGTSSTSNNSPFNKSTAAFGPALTQPSFGPPTTTVSFGTNAFDGTATTSSSVFGGQSSSSPGFGKPGAGSIFGGVANTQAPNFGGTTSKPAFGAGNTALPFGNTAPVTSTPAFGNTSTPSFNFGAKTTATSSFGTSFGTTTTASSGFGSTTAPAFGTSNSFGSGSTNFGNSSAFGGSTVPSFGAANSSTPAFGAASSATPAFGVASSTTPSFGAASGTTPTFGAVSTTTPAFGANSTSGPTFGTANTAAPAFGAGNTTTPPFGVVSTTSQPTPFGTSNTAPTFGTTNTGFGANGSKGPMFGASSTPSFGATTVPSFNSTTPTSGFGATSNATGFGANTSAFAKPQAGFGAAPNNAFGNSTSFGSTQPSAGFGASSPPNTQTPVFNFGAAAAPKPAGVFSFGAPSAGEPLKPTFNFTGGNSAPSFGSSGPPPFGSTGTPSFGAGGAPQFNPPQPAAPGMFSIGSGPTSGRTRTQLRAKRRT